MTLEALHEQVAESQLDATLALRAGAGWRIVAVVAHPFNTEEAAPLWVVFWERET